MGPGLGVLMAAQRKRRADSAEAVSTPEVQFETLEPDTTTAAELRQRSLSDVAAYNDRQTTEQAEKDRVDQETRQGKALFLSGLFGALGGDSSGVERLSEAIRERRERQARDAEVTRKMEEAQAIQENRRADAEAIATGDPWLAHNPHLGEAIQRRNEREAEADWQKRQDEERRHREDLTQRQEASDKPFSVSPEAGVMDPKTRQWIVQPQFRPEHAPAGQENQRRDDIEKAMDRINKHREASADYRAQMEAISETIGSQTSEGRKATGWDDFATDPRTGLQSGLTNRQAYQALKRKNEGAVGEINRLWKGVKGLRGQPEPEAPATPEKAATFTVARSKFNAKYPEAIRKQKEAELAAAGGVIDEGR